MFLSCSDFLLSMHLRYTWAGCPCGYSSSASSSTSSILTISRLHGCSRAAKNSTELGKFGNHHLRSSGNLWALEAHLHSCSFHSKSQNSENQSWWERRCPAIQTGDLPAPLQHLRFGPRDLTTFHWGRLTMVTVVVPNLGDCALGPSGSQRLRRVPRFGGLGRHADGARAPRHGRRRRHNDVWRYRAALRELLGAIDPFQCKISQDQCGSLDWRKLVAFWTGSGSVSIVGGDAKKISLRCGLDTDGIFSWTCIHRLSFNDTVYGRLQPTAITFLCQGASFLWLIKGCSQIFVLPVTTWKAEGAGESEMKEMFSCSADIFLCS